MQPEDVLKTVMASDSLPTLPTVASRLVSMTSKEETTIEEIAQAISQDVSLSAKLLKIANSSFYSFPTQVGSVNQAVSVMGTNAVRSLVLSFSFLNIRPKDRGDSFNYDRFWEKSLAAAVAAKLVASGFKEIEAEEIFIVGLLQNIGEMIIARALPQEYARIEEQGQKGLLSVPEAEQAVLGTDHSFVGYAVTKYWKFPSFLIHPIRYHHHPEAFKGKDARTKIAINAVHLSDLIVNILYSQQPETFHKRFKETSRKLIGLDDQAIDHILETVHTEIGQIANDFGLQIENPQPVEEILQEANIALSLMNLNYEQMNKALIATKLELQKLARELGDKNRRLEKLAHVDGLTEVYNHRYFQNFLEKEISRADRNETSISLVMIDVDHFKAFNDEHGHLAGDFILKEMCGLVQSHVREYDLLARYGGEEFVVVLPETGKPEAETVAEKLRALVAGHLFTGSDRDYQITVSVGVATIQPAKDRCKKNDLIDFADKAMYQSKNKGRNRVTVYQPRKKWFGNG